MDARKVRVVRFFALIYIVFGASVLYLLYFNTGISLGGSADTATGVFHITVKNSSIHLIRDLNVFVLDANGFEKNILSINALKPGEEKRIDLYESHAVEGVISLIAKAPFHLQVLKKIEIQRMGSEPKGELTVELKGQNKAFIGTAANFTLKICSSANDENEIKIENKFSRNYFSSAEETKTISLKKNECSEQVFKLLPSGRGKTTIVFNITTKQVNKRLEKEIEIID